MEEATAVTTYSSSSPVIPLLVLAVLIVFPLKLGAHFAGAARTGIVWCAATGVIGIVSGYVAGGLFGGVLGGPLASFIGFVVAIRFMLGTSLIGALGLTIVATGLTIVGFMLLDQVF